MVENYTNIYSNFPEEVMDFTEYADVDDSVGASINTIKNLQSQRKYGEAADYINSHSELKKYIFGAETINKLIEGNRNAQIFARKSKQQIYVQDKEPKTIFDQDVWIGGGVL